MTGYLFEVGSTFLEKSSSSMLLGLFENHMVFDEQIKIDYKTLASRSFVGFNIKICIEQTTSLVAYSDCQWFSFNNHHTIKRDKKYLPFVMMRVVSVMVLIKSDFSINTSSVLILDHGTFLNLSFNKSSTRPTPS